MVCNAQGKPVAMALTAGQVSDYKGAALLLVQIPKTRYLLADRGYDANWFRQGLLAKGITPCIPSKRTRKIQIPYNRSIYAKRHMIENLFAKLKDWRRIATRYDRCAHTFFSAICIAVSVIFYLN